jgi:hypothetical protein
MAITPVAVTVVLVADRVAGSAELRQLLLLLVLTLR